MEQHELKQAAEITAICAMIDFLMCAHIRSVKMTEEQAESLSDAMTAGWKGRGLSFVDPAMSDHLTAEVAESIDAFWRRARRYIRGRRNAGLP